MFFASQGIVAPSELKLLREALDLACPSGTPVERETVAARLLTAFHAGIRDRDELVRLVSPHR